MATATKLMAATRDRAGKGMARETRRQDRIPCVIYGAGKPPVMISVDAAVVARDVHASNFLTRTYDIDVNGSVHHVLPRDVQFHPVSDRAIHIDFLRIDATSLVNVSVPFEFKNVETAPGIKKGGVLNIVHHELEVRCRPDRIPSHITIDVGSFDVGTSVHLSSIVLPEGVTPHVTEKDFTIATIATPSALRSKEDDDAEATAAAAASAASTAAAAPAATPAAKA